MRVATADVEATLLAFEDFSPGRLPTVGPVRVSRDDIVTFAASFDPQPMHLDEEAGRKSMLGALAGSGWHMAVLAMRMLARGALRDADVRGVRAIGDLRWLSPFFPDRDVSLEVEIASVSQADEAGCGDVAFALALLADGERRMMTMNPVIVLNRRSAGSSATRSSA